MCFEDSKLTKYIGNNKSIKIKENNSGIHVIGNNCNIEVSKNQAALKMIGNNFNVKINSGSGSVDLIGNNGQAEFGHYPMSKCKFIGNNITINQKSGGKNAAQQEKSKYTPGKDDR